MRWDRNVTEMTDEQLVEYYAEVGKALHDIFDKKGLNLSDDELKDVRDGKKALEAIKTEEEKRKGAAAERDELDAIRKMADDANRASTEPVPSVTHPGAGKKSALERSGFKTLGQLFVESQAFKGYDSMNRKSPTVDIEVEDIILSLKASEMASKTLLTTGDWPSLEQRLPGLLEYPRRRPVIADLIPQAQTTSKTITYVEENAGTNAADTVAEGSAKPESALSFTTKSTVVTKIATWIPVTDELMEDEPALRGIIDARLRLFIQLAEEDQLMNGSGSSPDLRGMLNVSGIQTQAKGGDPTPDAIYKAMTKIQIQAKLQPDGVIMHPNDWQDIRLLRTPDGQYIWGSPAEQSAAERIWGLPVVATEAAAENTGVVGAFGAATQIFRRSGISFAVSTEHEEYFIKNLMAIRAEERLAFVVYRPTALCTVTGI